MTVEKLIKDLLKIKNQQAKVYFKTGKGLPVMEGISVPVEEVKTETVITLQGPQASVVIIGK